MPRRTSGLLAALGVGGVRLRLRGWLFLAASVILFFVAYTTGRQELLYIATLLGVLPIVAVIFVRVRRPRLAVTRAFSPQVIPAGSTASVSLVVRNLSSLRSVRATWRDELPWRQYETSVGDLPPLRARGSRFVGRGNSVALAYDLHPPRRGVFPVGPLGVEVADAFGLAECRFAVGSPQPITVTPEVIPLADTGMTVPAGDGESRLVQRRASGDEDDAMTREYRAGDAMRRVHWRATARKGELMVRQEEPRSFPEARILVDTRRDGYRDGGDDGYGDGGDADREGGGADREGGGADREGVGAGGAGDDARASGDGPGGKSSESVGGSGRGAVHRDAHASAQFLQAAQHDGDPQSEAFEWVVRMLASVAVHLRRSGFVVTVHDSGIPQLEAVSHAKRRTWGDEQFLASLASLELTEAPGTQRRSPRSSGPLIALVGTPDAEVVDWLLAQRQPGELAVAFMVRNLSAIDIIDRHFGNATAAPVIADRLTDAGWLVVPVRADDDHAAAWEAVVVETGRSRGSA
ncbi:MAG: DUF58 domain-containing protein [Rhodoglobus sp.]